MYLAFNNKFGWSFEEFEKFPLDKAIYWLDLINIENKNAERRIKSNNISGRSR